MLAGWGLAVCACALAAPDEIQVYGDEMSEPGSFGLEQHVSYSLQGKKAPDYPGQLPPHHVTRLTEEFTYGVSPALEAGLYLPLAVAPDGRGYLDGLRLRLKYVAPHAAAGWFYGLNTELGHNTVRLAESRTAMELRPIFGYRTADWLFGFNPILAVELSANVSRQPQFKPALKVLRRVGEGVQAGLEYYGELGTLAHGLPRNQQSHTVYAVTEFQAGGWGVNLGLGRGSAAAADAWVLKALIEVPF